MPADMSKATVASLYKKGTPLKQDNCRPVSLLNTFYKTLAGIIKDRLMESLEPFLSSTQNGFRPKRSAEDAIFLARRMQEYAGQEGGEGTLMLLDWEKKTFDTVNHAGLLEVLKSFSIGLKLTTMIAHIYSNPVFKVLLEEHESEWHTQGYGIRQGCPLSLYIFLLVMTRIFQIVHRIIPEGGESQQSYRFNSEGIPGFNHAEILFADDTLLKAANEQSLNMLLHTVVNISGHFGLGLSRSKCVQIALSGDLEIALKDGAKVKKEEKATYLGVILNHLASPAVEIAKQIRGHSF
jgi:hypothetical protein